MKSPLGISRVLLIFLLIIVLLASIGAAVIFIDFAKEDGPLLENDQAKEKFEDDNDEPQIIVQYLVKDGDLTSPKMPKIEKKFEKFQDDEADHQKIWSLFKRVTPDGLEKNVTKFQISTDGLDGELAAVERDENEHQLWTLSVDIIDAYSKDELLEDDLIPSLIHEQGHMITLSPDQMAVESSVTETDIEDCFPMFHTGDGCSKEDSYINTFFLRFWDDIYDEYLEINGAPGSERYDLELEDFYEEHKDEFINYEATDGPAEDIAETWMHFVIKAKPSGKNRAEKKILFFYDYPELVKIREEIRKGLPESSM